MRCHVYLLIKNLLFKIDIWRHPSKSSDILMFKNQSVAEIMIDTEKLDFESITKDFKINTTILVNDLER